MGPRWFYKSCQEFRLETVGVGAIDYFAKWRGTSLVSVEGGREREEQEYTQTK